MAGQFVDPFDHYSDTTTMYEQVVGTPVISSAYARFPTIGSYPNKGVKLPGGSGRIRKNLKSNQGTLICFFSYGGPLPTSSWNAILSFYDNGAWQASIGVTSTGAIVVYQGSGGSGVFQVSSALGLLSSSVVPSHGIEVQIVIAASGAGSVQVWLDGNQVINASGISTAQSGNNYANQAALGYVSGTGADIYCDYFRVWDNTGSYQNAPIGYDTRKLTKLPTGAGGLTAWTANGAAANWQCVSENPPDDDTTYVSSAGLLSDSYAMGTSGLTGVPSMVCVKSRVRKDDGATRTLQIGVRSGSSNGLGSAYTMGSTYAWVDGFISVDPATGSPPTAAAADAFQHLKTESA
jgi:hypothetical protein